VGREERACPHTSGWASAGKRKKWGNSDCQASLADTSYHHACSRGGDTRTALAWTVVPLVVLTIAASRSTSAGDS
jgi:hypothetical protein